MLLVFGAITMDLIFPVTRLPNVGDTLWSGASRMAPGGKGANQAVAAARDGARVTLVGAVGEDVLAEGALAGLAREGIDLQVSRVPVVETGRSAIGVDEEGRTIVMTDAGANLRLRANQVPDGALSAGTTLLAQMEVNPDEIAAAILRARRRGARVVFNLSPARPIAADALRAVHVLIGNTQEFAWAGEHLGTGNNPASLHAALGVTCVRMMGPQGVDAFSSKGWRHMPVPPIKMRDTSGAGDCFVGVFAGAMSRGHGLDVALRRGAVAAALSAEKLGVQSGIPHAAEIDVALRQAPDVTGTQAEVPD